MIKYRIEFEAMTKTTWYILDEVLVYYSPRYNKTLTVPRGYKSDGASGPAVDIPSGAWWVHDWACDGGLWDDGIKMTLWQEAMVLRDILKQEGRWVRAITWPLFTLPYRKMITHGERKLFQIFG